MSTILSLLHKEYKKSGLSLQKFADKVGLTYGACRSYIERESEPSADRAEFILKALGGDITRALPDYIPPQAQSAPIRVFGEVSAGSASISQAPVEYENVLVETFRSSKYWNYTQGEIIPLRVKGSSMEPSYQNRQLIACRAPLIPVTEIRTGTPCIIVDQYGEATFKLFQYCAKERRVYGIPINQEYDLQWWKAAEVQVQLVVIGVIQALDQTTLPSGRMLRE